MDDDEYNALDMTPRSGAAIQHMAVGDLRMSTWCRAMVRDFPQLLLLLLHRGRRNTMNADNSESTMLRYRLIRALQFTGWAGLTLKGNTM